MTVVLIISALLIILLAGLITPLKSKNIGISIAIVIVSFISLMAVYYVVERNLNKDQQQFHAVSQSLVKNKHANSFNTMIIMVSMNEMYKKKAELYYRNGIFVIFTILVLNITFFTALYLNQKKKKNEQTFQTNNTSGA